MLLFAGDPLYVGMDITIASFDAISEVNMVSRFDKIRSFPMQRFVLRNWPLYFLVAVSFWGNKGLHANIVPQSVLEGRASIFHQRKRRRPDAQWRFFK